MTTFNKYIGARYVPLIYGEWDNTKSFEPLTVVTYQGASYTSKTFVPVGALITDTQFWIITSNFSAQTESYRQEVNNFKTDTNSQIAEVSSTLTTIQSEVSTNTSGLVTANQNIVTNTQNIATNTQNITSNSNRTKYISYSAKDFTIVGDGITDDTSNLQSAFDNMNDGDSIILKDNYLVKAPITINKKIKIFGSGTIIVSPNFVREGGISLKVFILNADGIEIEKLNFKATGVSSSSQDNSFIWSPKGYQKISKCSFSDLAFGGTNFNGAIAFLVGGNGGNTVNKCTFTNCPGGVFTQQAGDIFSENVAYEPKDVTFAINGTNATGCSIVNNKIYNRTGVSSAGHIACEQGASYFIITGNYIFGIKDGYGIGIDSIGGNTTVGSFGEVANNIIDGNNYTSTSAQAGIVTRSYYDNIKIHDNIIRNVGLGQAGNACMIVGVGQAEIYNNTIDNKATMGINITGADRSKTLKIRNNTIFNNNNSWGIKVVTADLTNSTIIIKDNEFNDCVEGINTSSLTAIVDIILENNKFNNVTSAINMATFYGSWLQTSFNATGKSFKHFLSTKNNKEFYVARGTAIPTSGVFLAGDKYYFINPAATEYLGQICVTAGTSGTWKGFGTIQT